MIVESILINCYGNDYRLQLLCEHSHHHYHHHHLDHPNWYLIAMLDHQPISHKSWPKSSGGIKGTPVGAQSRHVCKTYKRLWFMNLSRCDHRHHNHMFFRTFIFLNPYSLNQKCVSASWVNTGRPNPSTTLSLPTSSPSLSTQFSSSSYFDRWTRQGRPLSASRSHLLLADAPDHVFVVDHHFCISFESSFGILFFHW